MKLRDFWIYPSKLNRESGWPFDADDHRHTGNDIHVREVSPGLDAAYAECERALELWLVGSKTNQETWQITKEAIAALRKANE